MKKPSLLIVPALVLLIAALAWFGWWTFEKKELLTLLEDHPPSVRLEETRRRIRLEGDPLNSRILLARALLDGELDASYLADLPPERQEQAAIRSLENIRFARTLAQEVLEGRPDSWVAHMVQGGSVFLERWRTGDNALFRERADWEEPLTRARDLAPSREDPVRWLAMAYLLTWDDAREASTPIIDDVLTRAFRDPPTLKQLLPAWLAIEKDLGKAYRRLPPEANTWQTVGQFWLSTGQFENLAEAEKRRRLALVRECETLHEEAAARRAGGDLKGARELYLKITTQLVPSLEHELAFSKAILNSPPGIASQATQRAHQQWLSWARPLLALGQTPLKPMVIARLLPQSGRLMPAEKAFFALAAGDEVVADRYFRSAPDLWSEAWVPYYQLKAQQVKTTQDEEILRKALRTAHRSIRQTLGYRRLHPGSEPVNQDGPTRFPATGWRWRGPTAHQEIPLDFEAQSLTLEFLEGALGNGALVEIQWDGSTLAIAGLTSLTPLSFDLQAAPGDHLITFNYLRGDSVRPGELKIEFQ